MAEFTFTRYATYTLSGGVYTLQPPTVVTSGTLNDGEPDASFEVGDTLTGTGGPGGTYVGNLDAEPPPVGAIVDGGGGTFYVYADGPGAFPASFQSFDIDTNPLAVCFAAGTRILTDRGEVAVEHLRAGDLVATLGLGGPSLAPVLFLGRRRIALAGHPQAAALAPVRIAAGALAENTPHRDLLVSSDHCLFLDGRLVPARLLVNGTSITVEQGLAEVTYFHIELPGHDVVLAEGAAAESWLDCGNRAWFANADVALLAVDAPLAAHASVAMTPCAPVLQAGPDLAAIRDRIALRSAATGRPDLRAA